MRYLYLLACLIPLFCAAADRPDGATPLLAANQQGLVERIGRIYAWRLIEPASAEARREYAASSAQFRRQLQQLSDSSKHDADLRDNYDLLAQQWHDFRPLGDAAPTPVLARQVLDASEDMAWIASKGGQMLAHDMDAGTQAGLKAEAIATLSQRLAKIYLLQSAGLNVPFLGKDLRAARDEFEHTTRELKALPINSEATRSQISLMDTQWLFFQRALDALASNRGDPALRHDVVTTSDRIYEVAIELAERYRHAASR